MEGQNDLPLPFGGSLYRKASHTTYKRRSRNAFTAKDGSKADGAFKGQDSGQNHERALRLETFTHGPDDTGRNGTTTPIEMDIVATARTAELVESAVLSPRAGAKRRRIDVQRRAELHSQSPVAMQNARSPSSELTELPSDLSDSEAAATPRAALQASAAIKTIPSVLTNPEKPRALEHGTQVSEKRGYREEDVVSKTPPRATKFLPAIVPSPKAGQGSSTAAFPYRRKARMLTRAESFGRTEATKDQKELDQDGCATAAASPRPTEIPSLPTQISPSIVPDSPRRSLARANTLAAVNFSPSGRPRQPLIRTASMPASPAKPALASGGVGSELAEKGGMPPLAGPAVKRTYGRARVAELLSSQHFPVQGISPSRESPGERRSSSSEDIGHIPPARHTLEQRESYADLVKRLEMDVEETLDWEETAESTDFVPNAKSLAELRSRGENRKFMDDLAWLLDGLGDDSLSVRRSSVIDLLNKMSMAGWFERLSICGQVEDICSRLLGARTKSTDLGFDLSLLEYLAYVTKASKLKSILSNNLEDILAFLLHVLESPSITFEFTGSNAKRKKSPALQTLDALRPLLGLADKAGDALSTSAMAASVIRATIHLCISGDIEIPSPEMLSEIRFKVVNAIHRKLAVLPDRIDLYEKGLDLFSDGTNADVAFLSDAVNVLSVMSTAWLEIREQLETVHCTLATDLANLLLIAECAQESMKGLENHKALRLLVIPTLTSRDWNKGILQSIAPGTLVLRLLITAAVGGKPEDSIGERHRESESAEEPEDESDSERDVSLPLGLLYNLMDVADDSNRNALLHTEMSTHCTRGKECVKQCRCAGRKPAIWHLCDLFNKQQDQRNENASAAFLAGYLTLLFTKCLRDEDCKERLLLYLAGSEVQTKINTLRDCLQQFAEVYISAQSRLQQIMPAEEQGSGDAGKEHITLTIEKGLQTLRDNLD